MNDESYQQGQVDLLKEIKEVIEVIQRVNKPASDEFKRGMNSLVLELRIKVLGEIKAIGFPEEFKEKEMPKIQMFKK